MNRKNEIVEPIRVSGYGKWVDRLCVHYKEETILFRDSSLIYLNALLNVTPTKTILIGVFNKETQTGKIFDRRREVRL